MSLLFPGSALEPMWRVNPRGREAFSSMGGWGPALLAAVCLACTAAAIGLWRGARWGYRTAVGVLAVQLAGDVVNVVLGTEPRAAVGIPIVVLMLACLRSRGVRSFFGRGAGCVRGPDGPGRGRGGRPEPGL